VSINDVKPGQVVARAVTNAGGAILCPPGFELTETTIERLKRAGVDAILLEAPGDAEGRVRERLEELHRRFQAVSDPIMLQIKATIEKRLNFMLLR
jgi:hypothetical protein